MSIFCTLITSNFLPFAKTLFQSLKEFDSGIDFYALVVDDKNSIDITEFTCLRLVDLTEQELVNRIQEKYASTSDAFRWSLKSVLMTHLLKSNPNSQVFFVDPDICFFSDFRFLYNELGDSSFLLSPHWKRPTPDSQDDSFISLFTHGLYNAGFVGATSKGINTLRWWTEMCLYSCEDNSQSGLFVDQKYLDLFPLKEPDTKILSHRGCNVAVWNRFECHRAYDKDGQVLINGLYPLVFVHFTYLAYLIEHDQVLADLLYVYDQRLKENGLSYSLVQRAQAYIERQKLKKLNLWDRFVRKLNNMSSFKKSF